ncbi:unnamed protein product [Fraxinus pennsylvanica]|uniref:NADP-dependent oxidoreductase domain-containing protein n=1 Tax=Fraxinus pennsylvanica TaxID=56036 RepID=A0AAD1ZYU7_9LAMI|nr:unnamed protein product [Fraxinus pennsylvanica]
MLLIQLRRYSWSGLCGAKIQRELGIGLVVYSPLGHDSSLLVQRWLKLCLKETSESYNQDSNLRIWSIIRICLRGTTKIENLNENIRSLSVKLTKEDMAELKSIAPADAMKGDRYGSKIPTWKNADTPPLSNWTVAA